MFPIARVVLGFGKVGQRKAYLQVSPDEIKAYPFDLVPEPQRIVKQGTHIRILADHCGFRGMPISVPN